MKEFLQIYIIKVSLHILISITMEPQETSIIPNKQICEHQIKHICMRLRCPHQRLICSDKKCQKSYQKHKLCNSVSYRAQINKFQKHSFDYKLQELKGNFNKGITLLIKSNNIFTNLIRKTPQIEKTKQIRKNAYTLNQPMITFKQIQQVFSIMREIQNPNYQNIQQRKNRKNQQIREELKSKGQQIDLVINQSMKQLQSKIRQQKIARYRRLFGQQQQIESENEIN